MSNSDLRQLPNTEQSNANTILQAAMAEQRRLHAERTRNAVNRITNPPVVVEDNHPYNTAEDLRIRRAANILAVANANDFINSQVSLNVRPRHPDNVAADREELERQFELRAQQEQEQARQTPLGGGKYRRSRKLKRMSKKSKRMSKKSKRYRKSKRVKR